jgi:hypothetical protein
MTDIRTDPVTDRSAWHRRDVEADRSWEHELTATHRQELAQALAAIGDAPRAQMDVNAFHRPALTELMGRVSQELQQGRGFALLHGFPVESCRYNRGWIGKSPTATGAATDTRGDADF